MNFSLHSLPAVAMCAGAFLIAPAQSYGAPITGTLSITGDATVSATVLTFLCDVMSALGCPANTGQFQVTGPLAQSGNFVALANTIGDIKNLDQTSEPINQVFSLPNFMTFLNDPNIAFDLTYISAGTGVDCAVSTSTTCTPRIPALVSSSNPLGLSPFNLSNTANGSSASFSVSGETRNVATGELAVFNGTFSATFTDTPGANNQDVAHVLAELAANGHITSPYDGKFVAVASTPEPATMALFGLGLLFVASAGRKKRQG
uniref:PEP-CTERM motif protein n=1 Tax=uncultured bacterium CSLF43 TaxID=1091575 RepID=G4WW13_9BACT|nr:PEP-CTERM motif protein [uncultured bacterium CSLF43]